MLSGATASISTNWRQSPTSLRTVNSTTAALSTVKVCDSPTGTVTASGSMTGDGASGARLEHPAATTTASTSNANVKVLVVATINDRAGSSFPEYHRGAVGSR